MKKGLIYGVCTYTLWGLLPIYWKLLQTVPAFEILAHRIVWSLIFLILLLVYTRHWQWVKLVAQNGKVALTFVFIATLLSVNWVTYIWAVTAGYIVETSLGYFINPLVSVGLGVLFLKERLRPVQWVAILVALSGVLYLTLSYGSLPWIALTLAFSFGIYGLLKKTAPLNALEGLSLETALLFLPAFGYLLYLAAISVGSFATVNPATTLLLALTGVITAIPLLTFAAAARRIPLSMVGLLQYIAPTLQVILGIFIYGEPFTRDRLIGFGLVWIALLIYSVESLMLRGRMVHVPYAVENR